MDEEIDELFDDAVRVVHKLKEANSAILQRVFSVGFIRAARLLDALEKAGAVGPANGTKPREILVKDPDEFLSMKN